MNYKMQKEWMSHHSMCKLCNIDCMWVMLNGKSERIEETIDPEQAIDRALETYQKKGYDTDWIHQRLLSIRVRNELTAEWQERGVQQGKEYIKQKETADQGPP